MLGRLGTGGAVAVAVALLALNVVVDSVLYFVSVLVDAATVAGAAYLIYLRDRALKVRHRKQIADLEARHASAIETRSFEELKRVQAAVKS